VRPVGRAHFHQPRAALPQHIGNAEPAADLDELPARDDHLAAACQRRERQQDRARVVVDHQRGLRAGQLTQQRFRMDVARAAAARLQVVFEVAVARGDAVHRGGARRLAQRRAAQVGVDDDARRVDHRS
jgi:hypothetical protein